MTPNVLHVARASADIKQVGRPSLLLLAYWFPPENESGALRPYRFYKFLPEHGYRPLVVAAEYQGGERDGKGVYRTRSETAPTKKAFGGLLGRLAHRLAPYNDRLDWVPQAIETASTILDAHPVEAIISTSPPVAAHVTALLLKRKHRVRWIADFRDPIVANPFRTRWRGRVYDRLIEARVVAEADAIVVNTDSVLESFALRYPRAREKIHVIWNGYDPEDEVRADALPFGQPKSIAHFGSIYGGRHPGIVVDSLHRLTSEGRIGPLDCAVRLIGTVDQSAEWLTKPSVAAMVDQGSLVFDGVMKPRDVARREMSRVDCLLLLDMNERGASLQVPAKLFEYVQIGRPILAVTNPGSPVERILASSGIPHVCVYTDDTDETVDRKILECLALPNEPARPSDWFRERFDSRSQTAMLARLIRMANGGR